MIFAVYTGSKNQVQNKQKIQFVNLDFFKNQVQINRGHGCIKCNETTALNKSFTCKKKYNETTALNKSFTCKFGYFLLPYNRKSNNLYLE